MCQCRVNIIVITLLALIVIVLTSLPLSRYVQVSHRQLRPVSLSDRPLTPMESLLEEIRTPPPLKRVKRISPSELGYRVSTHKIAYRMVCFICLLAIIILYHFLSCTERLSMSVECYRMSRSNSDLLDIPFSPNPLSLYTDAWANRNLSVSTLLEKLKLDC